jgi:hypothetical protein
MESEQTGGTYLYAVLPKESARQDWGEVSGVEESKVYSIDSGNLAAIVSDVSSRAEMRPERRHLAAHERVLKKATIASRAVLPVSFGTIADDREGVRELLQKFQKDLSEQMLRVEGKLEMRLRVTYAAEKPSVFEFLVANSPELRESRDAIARSGREPTREEKIDLGQKVDSILNALCEQYAERVEKVVGKLGQSKRNPPRNEREFVNLAFLVPKDLQADFGAAAQSAAAQFPDTFRVDQSGPYPPYDFVELHVKSLKGDA